MAVDPRVASDLAYILDQTVAVGQLHEELILLRIALRKYAECGRAQDAVAYAAAEVSDVLSRTVKRNP
jgi:hypothetical protein